MVKESSSPTTWLWSHSNFENDAGLRSTEDQKSTGSSGVLYLLESPNGVHTKKGSKTLEPS